MFCYLSGYLFKYEQYLFFTQYKLNKDANNKISKEETLSVYQFLMGSGKSTVIIPYLVYTNYYINRKKTIVLIPDSAKIKNEMMININKIMLFFNNTCAVYSKDITDYHDFLKNNNT